MAQEHIFHHLPLFSPGSERKVPILRFLSQGLSGIRAAFTLCLDIFSAKSSAYLAGCHTSKFGAESTAVDPVIHGFRKMDQDDPRDHFSLLNRFWMVLGYSLLGKTPYLIQKKGDWTAPCLSNCLTLEA